MESLWDKMKTAPQGHDHCQLSIVNCQFGITFIIRFSCKKRKGNIGLHNLINRVQRLFQRVFPDTGIIDDEASTVFSGIVVEFA